MADEQKTGDSLFSYKKPTNSDVKNMFPANTDEAEEEQLKANKQPKPPLPEDKLPTVQPNQPTQINLTFDLPPARPARRRRSNEKTFSQKHVTISLSIDKRIEKEVNEFLERGAIQAGNKTVFASQLFLKLLLNAGYKIDPNILANPE